MVCKYCKKKVFSKGMCKKHYMEEYRQSDAYKESQKRYQQSDAFKESQKRYRQSDAFKESQKRYRQSDAYKEYKKRYQQSDAFKESQKRYRQSDAYKERCTYYTSLGKFCNDFFTHFSRKINNNEDLTNLASIFSKNACELSGREQCLLEEMILKKAIEKGVVK